MEYEFRLPDIGEGVAEGEVVKWFVTEGATVAEDAPLVSVLTDKANVEIPSPKAGRILKLHAKEGEKVKVGGLLVTIAVEGASGPSAAEPAVRAPEGPADAAPLTAVPASPSVTPSESPPASPTVRVLATPFVRRLAAEKGVALEKIRGSGPGGKITEKDVEGAAEQPSPPEPARAEPSTPPATGAPVRAPAELPSGETERIPIRGVRRIIAEHMAEATHRAAHFTYVEEVDASELVRVRERIAKHVEKQGTRLTFLPFVVKGVVAGLRAYPRMNATMDDERGELVVHHRYHIGIAMAAPEGLIVPVIRDANTKSVSQLARELQEYGERGRAGKLTRAELTGSTFTITSLGTLGGVLATPILNYPEVAILGVHKIVRRPVYRSDGSIGPAELMNLSVSLDHRVIDGITGAQFLAVVKTYLEDPHVLFAELA